MATKKKAAVRRPAPANQVLEPQYKLAEPSYFGDGVKPAGSIITYWGVPGKNLIPINALARANKVAVQDLRKEYAGDAAGFTAAVRELDNEQQQIGDYDELGEEGEYTLSDADRKELEQHAQTTIDGQEKQDRANTNKVGVQLQGNPLDPEGKDDPTTLQGYAPVTNGDEQTIGQAQTAPQVKKK